jgi:hypothetical protein
MADFGRCLHDSMAVTQRVGLAQGRVRLAEGRGRRSCRGKQDGIASKGGARALHLARCIVSYRTIGVLGHALRGKAPRLSERNREREA